MSRAIAVRSGLVFFAVGVALLVALVFVGRSRGYLGGRADGGPLDSAGAGLGLPAEPGQVVGWNPFNLNAPGVTIESVHADELSPGLEEVGARVILPGRLPITGEIGWPPEEPSVEARGAKLTGRYGSTTRGERLVVGLRVPAPGVYYAQGLRVRYHKGRRHYERLIDGDLEVCAAPEPACSLSAFAPGHDRGLVFAGGYVQVQGASMRAEDPYSSGSGFADDETRTGEIELSGRPNREFSITVTLFNTGEDVELRGLRMLTGPGVSRYARQLGVDVATEPGLTQPLRLRALAPLRIRHGEARTVRIRAKFGRCYSPPKPQGIGFGLGPPLVAETDRGADEVEGVRFLLMHGDRPCSPRAR